MISEKKSSAVKSGKILKRKVSLATLVSIEQPVFAKAMKTATQTTHRKQQKIVAGGKTKNMKSATKRGSQQA